MEDFPNVPTKQYADLRKIIKSGDILLCSGNSFFSNLIREATQSVWSHVAFILRLDMIDRIMILESVESIGVRTVPLSSYIFNYNASGKGYPGRIMLARHHQLKQENIKNLSRFATDLLGSPYDTEEIASIAARISMNSIGINHLARDIPKQQYICSEYAYVCFKSVDIEIPYNDEGFIAPADFAKCQQVEPICFLETNTLSDFVSIPSKNRSKFGMH